MKTATRCLAPAALLLLLCLPAAAATPPPQGPGSAEAFARIAWLRGNVTAQCPACAEPRPLQSGDEVAPGDTVRTAAQSEVHLVSRDHGYYAVRAQSELLVQAYRASGAADDGLTLRLARGAMRSVTGWVARLKRQDYRIETPVSTIGIRGTDHEAHVLDVPQGANRAGTYDLVRRGGTALTPVVDLGSGALNVEPGQVGFVPQVDEPPAPTMPGEKSRMLLLLLPRILKEVPDFYVAGANDAAIDAWSEQADAVLQQDVAQLCVGAADLDAFSNALDQAIAAGQSAPVLALFTDAVDLRVNLALPNGQTREVTFDRAQFVDSTLEALQQMRGYQATSRIDARQLNRNGDCRRAQITRQVLESGEVQGKTLRSESTQVLDLVKQDGQLRVEAGRVQPVR